MNVVERLSWFRTKLEKRIHFAIANRGRKTAAARTLQRLNLPLRIYYRISDTGYPKTKPTFINNENCLRNATKHFSPANNRWTVIADNCSETTLEMIGRYVPEQCIDRRSVGHGAGTFRLAYEMALELPDNTPVYFLENDYLHRKGAREALLEGLELAPYVTLYDHPDKYEGHSGVCDGGELTRVKLSPSCHWKYTYSTTMTFAALVENLREDKAIFDRWTRTRHPYDCEIFVDLRRSRKYLISPLPSYSTHGESAFLAPRIDWEEVAE